MLHMRLPNEGLSRENVRRVLVIMAFPLIFSFLGIGSVSAQANRIEIHDIFFDWDSELYASPTAWGGVIYVYFKNNHESDVRIEDIRLGNRRIDDLLREGEVIWYDIDPSLVAPGDFGSVKIRVKNNSVIRIRKDIELSFVGGKDKWKEKMVIPGDRRPLTFNYIAYGEELSDIYLYLRKRDMDLSVNVGEISKIFLDGEDVTNKVTFKSGLINDLMFVKVSLEQPLSKGEYHVIKITTDKKQTVSFRSRVIEPKFPVAVYGNIVDVGAWKERGMGVYFSFVPLRVDRFARFVDYDFYVLPQLRWNDPEADIAHIYAESDNVLGIHLMDEPDTQDYSLGGLGKSGPELMKRVNMVRERVPLAPMYLAIDTTYRPANWHVYYSIADVGIGHAYPVPGGFKGTFGQIEATKKIALAAAPRPTYNIVRFFTSGKKETSRLPTLEEVYLQAIIALAKGAKGIAYYTTYETRGTFLSGDADPVLWDGITEVNATINALTPLLAIGDWAEIGESSNKDVSVDVILCGEKGMMVFVINQDFDSAPQGFTVNSKENIKVEVDIPYGVVEQAFKVINGEFIPFSQLNIQDGKAILEIPKVEIGDVFYLKFQ